MSKDVLDFAGGEDPMYGLSAEQRSAIEAMKDAAVRTKHYQLLEERRRRRYIEKQWTAARERYDALLAIQGTAVDRPPLPKLTTPGGVASPAAAVLQWSDWHVDSAITLEQTQGQNEYTVDIAWARFRSLVQKTIWQLRAWRKLSDLDTIVVAGLGDWIAGDIHSELVETCMTPEAATVVVREMLQEGLERLHKLKFIKTIRFVGVPDNHGRATKKNQWTNGHERSHNWGMYHALEAVCNAKGLDKLEFVIPQGSIHHEEVMGYNFRIMHGHQMFGHPGVAGQRGMKWIEKANVGSPADYTLMGHYHTARDHGALIMNGSLCGPDAYSTQNGFVSEAPVQLALLVRPSFGVCNTSRIFPVVS